MALDHESLRRGFAMHDAPTRPRSISSDTSIGDNEGGVHAVGSQKTSSRRSS